MKNVLLGLSLLLSACAGSTAPDMEDPALGSAASVAAIPLVAACRVRGAACAEAAKAHPCQLADASCHTVSECTAETLQCISDALRW